MRHSHTETDIQKRLSKPPRQSYLRDWIYGGIDGAVTTFAVVSGVVGAHLSPVVIIILGTANIIADGFSMAASNYLGTKSEQEEYDRYKHHEETQIKANPEDATQEIRQILINKGFSGDSLEQTTAHICSNDELWVSTMLHEEFGLPKVIRSPWRASLSTFSSFMICGFIPLIPYLTATPKQFLISCALTGTVFFIIGSLKSQWTLQSWWKSGTITLSIGAIAATLAYIAGTLLRV